jgi:hypothetical protein
LLQPLVQFDQEIGRYLGRLVDAVDKLGQQRRGLALDQIGRQLSREFRFVREREFLGVGLEEEVEGVVHGHLGDQIDRDLESPRFLGEDEPRLIVGERVLLPVDEVFGWLDPHRIRNDRRTAMRRRPQAHDLR